MDKITSFESFKQKINKFDAMASTTDMTKPNTVFMPKEDKSIAERMQRFFDIADGNEWNV